MTSHQRPEALAGFAVVIELPVQWGDQDAFGHVNNTVPIRWYESARIAYMVQIGLGHSTDTTGLGPILASIRCDYRRQLHYPDTVLVGARVAHIGRTSLVMDHVVYSTRLAAVAAEGSSTIVMFDYTVNRPRRMPDDLRAAIERVEGRSIGAPDRVESGAAPGSSLGRSGGMADPDSRS